MELRQLRHFLAVSEEGSITGAAKKLRLTQPALSRQIKALEEELDAALLERGAHSVALTPAGEVLAAEARKLVRFADAMVEKVRATAAGVPLRIGYGPSLAGDFLSLAIERFTQLHPRVRVSLHDWSSAEMRGGLAMGKLDLILAVPCEGVSEPIRWETLRSYEWRVVLSANHPLASKKSLVPVDLDGQRLLLFEKENYPDYWDKVTGFFRDNALQAKIAGEYDGVTSLLAGLEGGLGIALLSESSQFDRGARTRVVGLELQPGLAPLVVAAGVAADKPCPPQVLAFIEELKQAAREC